MQKIYSLAILILVLLFSSLGRLAAQIPQSINYQAVARTGTGALLVNQSLKLRVSILGDGQGSAVEYQEAHPAVTNQFGLFTFKIGLGEALLGSFNTINWAEGEKWVKIEVDQFSTGNFVTIGESQLVSVPFALYALRSDNPGTPGPTGPQGPAGPIGLTGPAGADGAVGPQGPQGPAGAAGAQGPQGPAGPIGLTGPAGATGAVGPQGPAGPTGATGAVGPQGPAGPIGLTGPAGANGADGAVGPQGPAGAIGPQGPAGSIGLTGPAGANGADGAVGPQGPQGPAGPIGLTGPAGANGADGAVGPQGPAGANGADGAVGPQGPAGPIGLTGPAGANGADGAVGPQGPAGPTGLTGPAGANGADGAVGPQGPAGPTGLTGPAGANGAVGPQGPAGANGADGAVGPQGPAGPIGLTGPAGANGADGAVGPQGPQGPAGPIGLTGPAGANGADGAVGPQGPAGPIGLTGPAGANGADGAVGPQGPAGANGADGAVGPQGPAGATGAVGPQGPAGPIGLTGPAGADGAVGPQGPAGPQGPPGSAGNAWDLFGNTGTTAGTNYIGTTDNVALAFKVNGADRMRIDNNGRLGIGTIAPQHTFDLRTMSVNGGAVLQVATQSAAHFIRLSSGDDDIPQQALIGREGDPLLLGTSNGSNMNEYVRLAPNGNVGITNPNPDASARLDIASVDKGVLLPRVALTATNVAAPVTAPATSLMVYNTQTAGTSPYDVSPGYYYWTGSNWNKVNTARVLKYSYPPIDIPANSLYAITGTGIPTDVISSIFINVEGEWDEPPYFTITHVEARNGEVRFVVDNYSGRVFGPMSQGYNYLQTEFTITVIMP